MGLGFSVLGLGFRVWVELRGSCRFLIGLRIEAGLRGFRGLGFRQASAAVSYGRGLASPF